MPPRRLVLVISLVLILAAAVGTYWIAHRTMVVGRAMIGGPPPGAVLHHEDLVGRAAPDFTAIDLSGHRTGTAVLRGRVVIVDVWATWCRPCVEELPRVERELWQRFQPELAVVAIARKENALTVRKFNRHANLTFALVADPGGDISRRFGGDDAIPRTYVINRSGVIVHQTIGYGTKSFDDLVSAVQSTLARR
ncbi:MAG TPA: TlpA disulfide reductase family protein [Thermoanaerobaculia bacterium]|nr:TlpA disulfide reductase family protein [Thermoanaerobaculia bacterium]